MDEIRWGIIGCGDVAEYKSGPALYGVENSSLVAVMSRRIEKAKSFSERHGNPAYYDSVEALLSDSNVNAVYIGTPPGPHPKIVKQVAEEGKHILCEKPMANSVAECQAMIDICDKNGVQLMIAYYRRFFPIVSKMRDIIADGVIGDPIRVHATCGFFNKIDKDSDRGWLLDPSISGGGFLVDVATHRLDLMSMFFGKAKTVGAIVETQTLDIEVDDASSLVIKFENGVHGTLAANWNSGSSTDYFEIQGTKGRMYTHSLSGEGELEVEAAFGRQKFQLPAPKPVHLYLVHHYVQSLLSDKPMLLDGHQGMMATQITEAAYESAKSDKFVSI